MTCLYFQDKISAQVDEELKGSLREEVEAHIKQCQACKKAYKAEIAVKKLITQRLPRETAPISLRARIRRELEKESKRLPLWSRLVRFFAYKPIPAYVIAGISLIAFGFGLGRLSFYASQKSPFTKGQMHAAQPITMQGQLVCINCSLHGAEGHPIFCKEHNHMLGIRLADGSIWSILENEQASGLHTRYADMHKTVVIEGVAYVDAKYVEIRKFKIS